MLTSLSSRGQKAFDTVLRSDLEIFFQAMENRYHAEDNPDGALPLNVAENVLSWDRLKSRMKVVQGWNDIPAWVAGYTSCLGSPDVRLVFAEFLSKYLAMCPVNSEHLALSAGSTAVIEMTSWLLAEEGDVAVFPAPCYPVYKNDVGNKSGMIRYDLVTHHHLTQIQTGPNLSIAHLETAKKDIESQGRRFRMLVLTTPDNPTGGIYAHKTLNEIAQWCMGHQIHLVVSEIYGLSLINIDHPEIAEDYINPTPFQSFASLMDQYKSDYLHMWYALSKDFGASGFRFGLLYSQNEALLKAYDNYNAPHMVSNHTQWLFQSLLSDHRFVDAYIEHNRGALTDSYIIVVKKLRELNVPFVPSRGSLFVWIDLSAYMSEQSKESENQLWLDIYHNTGVLFTPGDGFGHSKYGQFRVVYTCVTKPELEVAMDRLGSFLKQRVKS